MGVITSPQIGSFKLNFVESGSQNPTINEDLWTTEKPGFFGKYVALEAIEPIREDLIRNVSAFFWQTNDTSNMNQVQHVDLAALAPNHRLILGGKVMPKIAARYLAANMDYTKAFELGSPSCESQFGYYKLRAHPGYVQDVHSAIINKLAEWFRAIQK